MRKLWIIVCFNVFFLFSLPLHARQAHISGLRFWTDPENTRLVFDISEKPAYRVQLLKDPYRLLIELRNAALSRQLVQPPKAHPLLASLQSAVVNGSDLRIEVGLKGPSAPKSFALAPNKIYGDRLVIDLSAGNVDVPSKPVAGTNDTPQQVAVKSPKIAAEKAKPAALKIAKAAAEPRPAAKPKTAEKPASATVAVKNVKSRSKDIVIAIDAGHGGEDPGAHGLRGVEEKAVVYAIAKKLEKLARNHPGIRPVMVRNGDYYVGLRKRMDIARNAKADLFVSIHADAYKDNSVRGASVFTLSPRGASSEAARWLADSENASDLVGGVSLEDKDDVLASVLLDLSQTATLEASQSVAKRVLRNFSKIGALHHNAVQKAGFAVLKSPDIPSILVETAFISNPGDEENLRSERYQAKVAQAIFNGILDYFQHNPPPGARIAASGYGKEG
jgi:N-acetylmuramoyl-L-alanine amidase